MNNLIELSKEIAIKSHEGQFRRDGKTPYLKHVLSVSNRLKSEDDIVVAAAMLHDCLEMSKETPESLLSASIPQSVVSAVEALTHNKGSYFAYLSGVKRNPIALKVKIADMLDNLGDNPTEKQIIKYSKGLLFLHGIDVRTGGFVVNNPDF